MPIVRIDKNTNFTTIHNSLLRDTRLSLRACGLLCKMLSHCDSWNFTINGLTAGTKDGRTVVSGALKELEDLGYLVRKIVRDNLGRIKDTEYWIYDSPEAITQSETSADGKADSGNEETCEEPQEAAEEPSESAETGESAASEEPVFFELPDTPFAGFPNMDSAPTENRTQRNTIIRNNNTRKNIYKNSKFYGSSIHQSHGKNQNADVMEYETAKELVKRNIGYDSVCAEYPAERVDEIVEIAAEVVCMPRKTITLGTSVYPYALAKNRILKLTADHVRFIIDSIDGITHRIRHIKPYLTKTILEAGTTINAYRRNGASQRDGFEQGSFDTASFFNTALNRAYET